MTAVAGPVSLIATLLGSAVSGMAAYSSAQYQAAVARQNAQLAAQEAERARFRGDIEAQTQDLKTRALVGQQLASQGASGLALEGRTLTDVRDSTRMLGRLDALTKRNNAEREAYGYQIQQYNYENEAKAKGRQASFGLAGSILGGASQLSNQWLRMKDPTFGRSIVS